MFTRQANQIQYAMQPAGQAAASDMVQALCNCAQTLEHRGPAQFNYQNPWDGLYPGLQPPPGQVNPYETSGNHFQTPVRPGNVSINIPPWQPLTWTNMPFIDIPASPGGGYQYGDNVYGAGGVNPFTTPWFPLPLPDTYVGGSGVQQSVNNSLVNNFSPGPNFEVPGGISAGGFDSTGPVSAPEVTAGETTTLGDMYTEGDAYVEGDTYNEGDVTTQGDTTHVGAVLNTGDVINDSSVTNNGPVINSSIANHYGENFFHSTVFVTTPSGRMIPLTPITISALSSVYFDPASKKIRKRSNRLEVFGIKRATTDSPVMTFVMGGAKFDGDACALVEDTANPPEISFVSGFS